MNQELIERARTKAAMLRMGEPIEFGSDAAIIEELADALEGGVPVTDEQLLALAKETFSAIPSWPDAYPNLFIKFARAALSAPAQRVEEGMVCDTCNGSGHESPNQLCRDCDELAASPAPAPHAGNEMGENLFNALHPFIGSANSTRVAVQELHRLGLTSAPHAGVDADIPDYDAGLLNDFGGGDVSWWQDYLRAEIERANQHWRAALEDRT